MNGSHSDTVPDFDREQRLGFPEVIYCPGKSDDQLRDMAAALFKRHTTVIATRATAEQAEVLREVDSAVAYHQRGCVAYLKRDEAEPCAGPVAVVSAGSADVPVAEEAACTAYVMGMAVSRVFDVGVAGLHRVLSRRERLQQAAVVIVAAGMEGALPSVVGGLVSRPVIAVPTSVGYGTSFQGVTPLLGMLNSCAPGLTVVNVDNGFGAAFAAARIVLNGVGPGHTGTEKAY